MFHRIFHLGQKIYGYKHLRFLAKILQKLFNWRYCCDIPFSANIDSSVWFCHRGFGCVINAKTIIERNCKIQHMVTIGEKEENGKSPHIMEGVFIGAKSIVIGDIVIGQNSRIGAGSIVVNDVQSDSTIIPLKSQVKTNF